MIGKHQNPWKECHIQKMEEDQVHLARRRSGGGAIYQDYGNTTFTFIAPREKLDKQANFNLLCNALKSDFNIDARLSGRNDICVGDRKVSGNAFKVGRNRELHHGTFLVNVDLNALGKYLNPQKMKLASKGVTSVISRVSNLNEVSSTVNHESLSNAIIKQFFNVHQEQCKVEELTLEKLSAIPSWSSYYNELKNDKWRFGQTPQFSHYFETRFEGIGLFNVHMDSKKNVIEKVKIFSDSLFPQLIEMFEHHLINKQYSVKGIQEAVDAVLKELKETQEFNELELHVKTIGEWLAKNL